ncbi:MAG TPA: PilZ domain-containing protein [Rhodanobacteraceae bacterium]|nr:PilZ domain-containing protein [Rhodanobacteraceae bacterium]
MKKSIRVHTLELFAIGDIDKSLHGKTESSKARPGRGGVEFMADRSISACRDQLHHAAVLPVEWTSRPLHEDAASIARRLRRNLAALAVDAAGDERRERPSEDGTANVDLQRIDSKLNAIMELFALLLERDLIVPDRVPLRFNAHGIEWEAPAPPVEGAAILVRIHLETCPSLPLELAAVTLESPGPGWAAAGFDAMRPPLNDAIARMIFREHRRQVADSIDGQY